ncbi:MAG TPA: sulfatase [Thermoanaerobaculia bacterium]|nr:sulfatase [Thermoanaerobaculia bacterium]
MNGLRPAALLLLLALAPLAPARPGLAAGPAAKASAESRPNILVIMTDDQTVEQMRALPKTRRLLAARGTTFANSFVEVSLCCPSRSTFLTGQYAHNHGVLANGGPHGGYVHLDHSNTLPLWLQEAGYYTAHVGKYLNNYGKKSPAPPPGWSRWFALTDPTVYRMYDYTVSDDGRPVTYGEAPKDYQTDVIAARAEEILRSRAGKGQPFFVTVAPTSPHLERLTREQTPPRPAPRYAGRYAAEAMPRKPSFDEADIADKPGHIRKRPRLSPAKRAHILATYRACLASLLAADDLVERLVKALDQTGQLGHTVIVFTSDNGFFFGEHRVAGGKYLPYEESIRVPLIIYDGRTDGRKDGRFPAGLTVTQPVANVDLAPTIVDLAGARARRVMDGRSLLPLVHDPRLGKDRTLLIEGFGEGHDKPPFTALRDPRWFYAEYRNGDTELYDLRNDPFELRSLHADPAFAAVRQDLARRLARLRTCAGSTCG